MENIYSKMKYSTFRKKTWCESKSHYEFLIKFSTIPPKLKKLLNASDNKIILQWIYISTFFLNVCVSLLFSSLVSLGQACIRTERVQKEQSLPFNSADSQSKCSNISMSKT